MDDAPHPREESLRAWVGSDDAVIYIHIGWCLSCGFGGWISNINVYLSFSFCFPHCKLSSEFVSVLFLRHLTHFLIILRACRTRRVHNIDRRVAWDQTERGGYSCRWVSFGLIKKGEERVKWVRWVKWMRDRVGAAMLRDPNKVSN